MIYAIAPTYSAEPALELNAIDGSAVKPFELHEKRAAVFVFFLHDCPVCNAYAPELERIRLEYEPKGLAFYIVQTDAGLSAADAKKHAAEYGFKGTVLLDPAHKLVARCGAKMTPEAAVCGADGKVLYLGRIDDLFADFGKRREQASVHDLRAALDAVYAGTAVPKAAGLAVGCLIPGVKDPAK